MQMTLNVTKNELKEKRKELKLKDTTTALKSPNMNLMRD